MKKTRLSEADAKRLLDRASELDAERAQSLDPAVLREIAAEAGISPAAIDAALEEHLESQQPKAKRRWTPARITLVAIGGLLVAIGGLLVAVLLSRLYP